MYFNIHNNIRGQIELNMVRFESKYHCGCLIDSTLLQLEQLDSVCGELRCKLRTFLNRKSYMCYPKVISRYRIITIQLTPLVSIV